MPKLTTDDFIQIHYKDDWSNSIPWEESKKKHRENIAACKAAIEYHNKKDRPLNILAIHGSGRSAYGSAGELSNSQLILSGALEQFYGKSEYEVTEIPLKAYAIDFCNCCYSTASALCNFPCSCAPWDQMQELYPLVLKCDVILCSTGVNQSAMSSRLKTFMDRLISLDGGFYIEELPKKDAAFKDKAIALSLELANKKELHYDARMWGRVAAYFITSKDQNNTTKTIARPFKSPLNYIEMVAYSLRDGMADYGFFHSNPWYVGAAANPNDEMSYDKDWYSKDPEIANAAFLVAQKAIELAKELRVNPPPFDGGGRPRTRT